MCFNNYKDQNLFKIPIYIYVANLKFIRQKLAEWWPSKICKKKRKNLKKCFFSDNFSTMKNYILDKEQKRCKRPIYIYIANINKIYRFLKKIRPFKKSKMAALKIQNQQFWPIIQFMANWFWKPIIRPGNYCRSIKGPVVFDFI